jgi:hypothetical protein
MMGSLPSSCGVLESVEPSRLGVCHRVQLGVYLRVFSGVYLRTYSEMYLGAYSVTTWKRIESILGGI